MKPPHPGTLIKEPIDARWMPKDHKSRSGWKIKAAEKNLQHFWSFVVEKNLPPGTVNDPCLRNKSLYACCVLARPFNIHSQALHPFKWQEYAALIESQSPAAATTKCCSVFLHAVFWSACMPWRSRLGGERERVPLIYLWLFPRLSG